MGRKVTIREGLGELFENVTIVYVCYVLIQWELNPMRWHELMKFLAIFLICIYFPYRDNQRWERDKDKDK